MKRVREGEGTEVADDKMDGIEVELVHSAGVVQ